jgi:hypothetical protein
MGAGNILSEELTTAETPSLFDDIITIPAGGTQLEGLYTYVGGAGGGIRMKVGDFMNSRSFDL